MRSKAAMTALVVVLGFLLATNPLLAQAAGKITGQQIKNGSVTGKDIKNGSLLAADFRAGELPQGEQGEQGPQGEQGEQGPSGVVASFASSGMGANPSITRGFLHAARVSLQAGQAVHVASTKALGSIAVGGAHSLDLWICSRPVGGAITSHGTGSLRHRVPQHTRLPFTLATILSGLPAGEYDVGLCGAASQPENWNSNEFGYTAALVFTAGSDAGSAPTVTERRRAAR